MIRSSFLAIALGASTLVGCSGLKDALTAHVDVVAKAGSQELSVTRLGDLLGKAQLQVPVNKEVATLVARDLWVPYQLLALAAARNDSLTDVKAIDAAAGGMIENAKLARYMESVSAGLKVDSTADEASYAAGKGGLFGARHILFTFPEGAAPAAKDSVRRKAEAVRAQVTPANFAAMANQHSQDPGNAPKKGGDLGLFPRGMMVKPFGDAVATLQPGQISAPVETQYGFHIIQRSNWNDVRAQYSARAAGLGRQVAESTFLAQTQQVANVKLKDGAAAAIKEVTKDPLSHRSDKKVIATFSGGELTAGRVAMVLMATPQSGRLMQQIQSAPDSMVNMYVMNMAQREVLLRRADSAKVGLTPEEMTNMHRDFLQVVTMSWQQMGISPKTLSDSAKTQPERERLAAARVEGFLDRIMAGQAQPIPVPLPLQIVLMDKYKSEVNAAGVDRAVERASQLRASTDSTRAAQQPPSAVPLPGAPAPGAGGQTSVPPTPQPRP